MQHKQADKHAHTDTHAYTCACTHTHARTSARTYAPPPTRILIHARSNTHPHIETHIDSYRPN